ncbi:unnamed protein product [Ambrosiozyma monospora]|uniref:Unnamed protein product n=1 Tax=Ambrosiozyma monospora TaxID=43982 RepID=A0ACB5TDG8_AMBMO|nr:unnamed protein product [Ambrosiozyma monospora]
MDNMTLPMQSFDANSSFQYDQEMDRIHYDELLKPILEDAQTRLVFKVQSYVDKNIVSYKKTGKELTIGRRRNKSVSSVVDEELAGPTVTKTNAAATEDVDGILPLDLADLKVDTQLLYPPVLKSIQLLSRIYQLLNQSVFDDLANSVVHLVILSMRDNFSNVSSIEAKLYLIKNLIFFRDYINTFDIEHVRKETNLDFGGLRNLFPRFIRGDRTKEAIDSTYQETDLPPGTTHNYLFNVILGTIPKVVNDFVDCRYELQMALRNAVHSFIEDSKVIFINPLGKYPEEKNLDDTMQSFMKTLKSELPRLRSRIMLYIDDLQILHFLIDGIKEVVLEAYEQFYKKALSLEKSEQIEYLLDMDTLVSLWADIVSEMLEGEEVENTADLLDITDLSDVEDTTVAANSTTRIGDDTNLITENGDVSNFNLDLSLQRH